MSKTKTKQRRREAKREHQKKASKNAAKPSVKTSIPAQLKSQKKQNAPKSTPTKPHVQASQKHDIPFDVYDRILLVGEGDFSFTKSLVVEHGCASVTATSFDSEEEVQTKYPTFAPISQTLSLLTPPVPLFHSIDATKISSYKHLRPEDNSPWDAIAFMFPHVGGLSTDVNRQVRSNQALLVSFFKSILQLPTDPQRQARKPKKDDDAKPKKEVREFLRMGGKVVVALFEGEPYTLWNIRDLARHSGLKVVESYKFDWEQYPGYGHVRTLGAIEGGGAWRGEEREARMYVFEKVELEPDSEEEREKKKMAKMKQKKLSGQGKKRPREDSGSESENENESKGG